MAASCQPMSCGATKHVYPEVLPSVFSYRCSRCRDNQFYAEMVKGMRFWWVEKYLDVERLRWGLGKSLSPSHPEELG